MKKPEISRKFEINAMIASEFANADESILFLANADESFSFHLILESRNLVLRIDMNTR